MSSSLLLRSALRFGLGPLASLVVTSLCAARAHAMEDDWHVGAGAGLVRPSNAYEGAPVLALHAVYGLSDTFDARLTLAASKLDPRAEDVEKTTLALTTLGLAYKLDVIEWVPYVGVRAGYFHFGPAPSAPYATTGGVIGAMVGIDYSFSRSFAVGAELARDLLLPEGSIDSGLLRAEYRFGF